MVLFVSGAGACATGAGRRAPLATGRGAGGDARPPVAAGVVVDERTRFYDVTGLTAPDVARALRANGLEEFGHLWYAAHRASFAWRFIPDRDAGGCRVRAATVSVESQVVLPRWRPGSDSAAVPDSLRRQWLAFVDALWTHELGHRAISVRTAAGMVSAFRSLRGATCTSLPLQVDLAGREFLDREAAEQRRYDDAGTQRARAPVWPPLGARPAPAPSADAAPGLVTVPSLPVRP